MEMKKLVQVKRSNGTVDPTAVEKSLRVYFHNDSYKLEYIPDNMTLYYNLTNDENVEM